MAERTVESEVKLEAGVGFVIPSLAGLPGGVTATSRPERRLTACYVDTPDLRLMRSGVTLRHRHETSDGEAELSEWTLKLPVGRDGPMIVRREMRWPGAPDDMPAEVDALVRAWRRALPLGVVARLVTVRQRTALRDPDGSDLAELDDDVVSVMDGHRLAARFREVELESTGASRKLVGKVVERLEEAGARRGDGVPKVVRALGAPAVGAPDVEPVVLLPKATMADVVRAALADAHLRIVAHHAGIHLDDDIEHVHQARVATRRLRSDLRFLRRSLDRAWVSATRDELGWYAAALGAVRDADVLTERLRAAGASLPAEDVDGVQQLLAVLADERARAMDALVEAIDSPRYVALLDRLVAAVADPPVAAAPAPPTGLDDGDVGLDDAVAGLDDGDVLGAEAGVGGAVAALPPAADLDLAAGTVGAGGPGAVRVGGPGAGPGAERARRALPAAVRRPWRHLRVAVADLGEHPDDEALHQVRIAAKRLRYACETATPVCGREARDLGRAAADLQTVLGDFHDAVVAAEWLRRAATAAPPAVAVAAGQLIARERADAAGARAEWARAWKRLAAKELVAWLRD